MIITEAIETKNLVLRELKDDDFEDIYKMKSDNKVVRFLTWGPSSREQTLKSLKGQIDFQKEANREMYILAVVLKEVNIVIGNALFMIRSEYTETAEIGYFLNSNYWGKGYGKEIIDALKELGFHRLNMHRIFAVCDKENEASIALLKKSGFRLEGHLIKNIKIRGEWRDNYIFALLREEHTDLISSGYQAKKMGE
ncbi:RimJ/RimL family protein N-acetyltransferase [Bacillus mesophilus]|uniref:GNAT family N-acetyltransferase n=1 Tax=Bacillus mesophilus TaxID=1808955 RepID=A0A6M0Q9T5_9BACI|nr:GNAT family protein [Bacillus mesophilus]MBM7662249.1 RimJ/RimL family protein N-acetyltransferase [Bacillus mesophilus]NEY73112.1 GNAT family N-acetyltransferase [Bacillus mesophilus]